MGLGKVVRLKMYPRYPRVCALILFVISGLQCSWADEAAELRAAQEKLAHISEEIASLEESLKNQRNSRSSLENQLAELEKDMGSIYGELRDLDSQIGRHDADRQRLVERKGSLLEEIGNHDAAFAQQIRLAYLSSRESKLKLLLNQEEPQKMGRYLVMYDYINNARWQQIDEMTQLVLKLKDNERELEHAQEALKQRREVQTQHSVLLKQAQKQKLELVGQLEASIKDQSDQLAEHKDQQNTLSKLLSSLTDKLRSRKRSLKGMEGSLSWPVEDIHTYTDAGFCNLPDGMSSTMEIVILLAGNKGFCILRGIFTN